VISQTLLNLLILLADIQEVIVNDDDKDPLKEFANNLVLLAIAAVIAGILVVFGGVSPTEMIRELIEYLSS